MVQTIFSQTLLSGQQKVFLEKPLVLRRIFFRITALLPQTASYISKISFDDPQFHSYNVLVGPTLYFEAAGADIFQGNIWVNNASATSIWYSATEILSQQ